MIENLQPQQFEVKQERNKDITPLELQGIMDKLDTRYLFALLDAVKKSSLDELEKTNMISQIEDDPNFREIIRLEKDRAILFPKDFDAPDLHDYSVEKEVHEYPNEILPTASGFTIMCNLYWHKLVDYDFNSTKTNQVEVPSRSYKFLAKPNHEIIVSNIEGLDLLTENGEQKLHYDFSNAVNDRVWNFDLLPENKILAMIGHHEFNPSLDRISILNMGEDGHVEEETLYNELNKPQLEKIFPNRAQMQLNGDVLVEMQRGEIYLLQKKGSVWEISKDDRKTFFRGKTQYLSNGNIVSFGGSPIGITIQEHSGTTTIKGDIEDFHALQDRIVTLGLTGRARSVSLITIYRKDEQGRWDVNDPEEIMLNKYAQAGFNAVTYLRDGRIVVYRARDGGLPRFPNVLVLNGKINE